MTADKEFRRMVKEFGEGRTDVIVMHIDTTKLLTPEELGLLKVAGANVVVGHKTLPTEEG